MASYSGSSCQRSASPRKMRIILALPALRSCGCFGSALPFSFVAILTTVVSCTSIEPSVTMS